MLFLRLCMMGRQRLRGSKPEKLRSFQRQRPVGRMGLSRLSVMKKQKQSKQYHILLLWMRQLLREISEPPSIWRIMSLDWGRDLLPAWMWMWSLRQREDIVSDVLSRRVRPLPIQVSRVLSAVMAKSVSFIPRMQVFSMVLPISEIW